MIRLLNLGPAEHEEVAIYVVNQRIPNVRELRELLCSGAIRRHQLGAKDLLTPTSSYESDNEDTYLDQIRIGNVHWQAALVCSDFP